MFAKEVWAFAKEVWVFAKEVWALAKEVWALAKKSQPSPDGQSSTAHQPHSRQRALPGMGTGSTMGLDRALFVGRTASSAQKRGFLPRYQGRLESRK